MCSHRCSNLGEWRNGFEVTTVEQVRARRSNGNSIDVKGPAVDVVEAIASYGDRRTHSAPHPKSSGGPRGYERISRP
ncbi:hypothetical protein D7D52_28655 [Nocardia yunnanensis]|uniref:Uncharacterized protein n=1 Tax=Nocardia yunnanensis TaxID=2382165 RepID=A0A386ZKH0_9NOCA|nr:hypothetical protein D7D52_28655 [Nocardia yunnanensis]